MVATWSTMVEYPEPMVVWATLGVRAPKKSRITKKGPPVSE